MSQLIECSISAIGTIIDENIKLSLYMDLIILASQKSEHLRRITYEYCQQDMAEEYNQCIEDLHKIKCKIIEIFNIKGVLKMLEHAIAKIDSEIVGSNDKIKSQIGEIAKAMLNAAPECASKVVDGDGSIKKVYEKMKALQSGPDSIILDLIKEVYGFDADFQIKLEIIKVDKTAQSQTIGKPKGNVTSIFDFM